MNFSRFARYLLALLVSAGLAAPMAYAYDKDKGKDKAKGKAKHEDKHKDKDPITGGHDRDDDRDDDDGNGGMRFRGMDRNGDGRITRREWRGNDNSFRNHDCNNDGVLSGGEVRPGAKCAEIPPIVRGNPPITRRNPPITRRNPIIDERTTRFRQMDVNRNGYVSLSEWAAGSRSDFDVLDRNNDGRLSLDEFVHRRS